VSDTGIGINKEAQEHLFDAFTQADASTTRKYGGTGLGLAISQKIAQHMSSNIVVESEEGKGTSFWFDVGLLLDLDRTQESADSVDLQSSLEQQQKEASFDELSGHVLVVEDNQVNQMVLTAILEEFNITFDIANNGQEAVDHYQTSDYDAVLMDCQMPVMDGYAATEAIRSLEDETGKRVPIIAVTANALASDKETCFKSGMDDFLPKPVMPEDLLQKLQKWL
jgi:CheY-like chemotaxis protein